QCDVELFILWCEYPDSLNADAFIRFIIPKFLKEDVRNLFTANAEALRKELADLHDLYTQ
ncbi:MAG: hypothetical protein LBD41_00650, partial [Clostridiales Family XIII bacterium]|nr:hypothetical protein [Clostridiales Family XIII bacterium]